MRPSRSRSPPRPSSSTSAAARSWTRTGPTSRRQEGLDEGTLDRLRLDGARVDVLAAQMEAMAELEPLAREVDAWTLPNGLRVTERRIPVGAVGANFEARPNVALDVAGQLLKSLNSAVLRTGSAALRTVTVLVDGVLRPALETAGLPPGAVGLVRSADHEGARLLVSFPRLVPLVILRGSGETTAALARLAAEHGVRTLAHAEGGGVLLRARRGCAGEGARDRAASIDRLGVCNRLNLCLVDRAASALVPDLLELLAHGLEVRGESRAPSARRSARPRVGQRPEPPPSNSLLLGLARGGGAGRERGDVRARGRDRDRGPGRGAGVPRRLSRHGRVLARDDAVHGRLRAHRRAGDGDQRRLDARARAGP